MRYIQKQPTPPAPLADFLKNQIPVGTNLDYEKGFTRKPQLRAALVAEQLGLCGYTGVAIDTRLAVHETNGMVFKAHIEHMKPQAICRKELIDQGKTPGDDLGEDMEYRNMIAALLVEAKRGSQCNNNKELFGAVCNNGDFLIPVLPTQPDCGRHFRFLIDGQIEWTDSDGETTVEILRLNHRTLEGLRNVAIKTIIFPEDSEDENFTLTKADIYTLANEPAPQNGQLPEFAFVIQSVARSILGLP